MVRAAAYVRFSSDKQSEASLADQERNCRRWAEREGVEVIAVYQDAAISGARHDRPGYRHLLHDADAGRLEVLLVDDLSRLSRDSVETERVIRLLEFRGIRVVGVSDSYDSNMHGNKLIRGMRGIVNELYLDDLREKVHRGLTGKALKGAAAGGRVYGYTTVEDGPDRRYVVVGEQARVVRRIFGEFADGRNVRLIAAGLNDDGIPSPRGGTWAFSALYGHPQKGTGILRNRMYTGEVIWNRSRWVKDPETGRRVRRERPRGEWIVERAEHLRIIDDLLWQRVQARLRATQEATRQAQLAGGTGARPRTRQTYLLSGLIRCAECGGSFVMVNAERYACSWRKNRGAAVCGNRTTVMRTSLEADLVTGLVEYLSAPQYREMFIAETQMALLELAKGDGREKLEQQLVKVKQQIANVTTAIMSVGFSPALGEAIQKLEGQKAGLEMQLGRMRERRPAVLSDAEIGAMLDAEIRRIADLPHQELEEAREALLEILGEPILVHAQNGRTPARAEVLFSGSGGRI